MKFNIIKKGEIFINEDYKDLFSNNLTFEDIWNFKNLKFFRKKRYKIIETYDFKNKKIFIKKYLSYPEEAQKEWKNILFLWRKNFFTLIPVFFALSRDDRAIIGTEEVEGKCFVNALKNKSIEISFFISKIAEFLAKFHKAKLFHQDCYLNHFYYDEKEDKIIIIDVSRIKHKPVLEFYYQIKDLAQLKFSFSVYLENKAEKFWDIFIKEYFKINETKYNKKLFFKILNLKTYMIKRHTERVIARGEEI